MKKKLSFLNDPVLSAFYRVEETDNAGKVKVE